MNEKERNPSIVKAVEDSNKHSMERELMVHLKKVFHSNGSYLVINNLGSSHVHSNIS